jgi:peptide/nickel transport system substrate-binding protein
MTRNPYFAGTYDGVLPHIETLIIRRIDSGLAIPEMEVGGVDLAVQASGPDIPPGLALVEQGGFDYFNFPRNGSGGLFFHWDVGPTQFVEVRRAIAWTLDRHEFNNMWAAGHATTNDTLIAVASWMYQENRDRIDQYITYNYTLNLANATAELEAGGWIYNADGEPWEAGDGPRHKDVDGELMPLVLRWASPDANEIGAMLASLMVEPANSVGIYFDHVFVTMADFSSALLGLDPDNRFSMINGGLGIPPIDAVWNSYNPNPEFWGATNWTRTNDAELFEHAWGRRSAETREEYLEAWFGFISRFNVVLPVLPLNADTFHDFYREGLLNYNRTDLLSWARVIPWAHLDLSVWPNQ